MTRGRLAFALASGGVLWGLTLIAGAFFWPAYEGCEATANGPQRCGLSATLVEMNGLDVLVPVATPALIAALVWLLLRLRCTVGWRVYGVLADVLVGILFAFSVLAMFSIGLYVLPPVALLFLAVRFTPAPA